ncbi:MAG: succinate dehydrogenase, cytochrome b556 subunit [Chloroflexota bacterium]
MATLVLTITETLRYRGKLGQWSWALHRIAGLGTLLFLFLHVIDTSWAVFYPELYAKAIVTYQSPLFTLGEFALVASVVYHALNGFRIVIFDWKPQWWHRQADAARAVLIGTLIILVPTFFLMFQHVLDHYEGGRPLDLQLATVISEQSVFVGAAIAIVVMGILVSAVYSVIPGVNTPKRGKTSGYDKFMWTFMRVSGVLIIPLVFGHLAMMHVIQGVFDITTAGYTPVFTNLGPNVSGTAVEFVSLRWNTMFAGVFIWRIYDILLLAFAVVHGFNGLRYVVNDYAHNIVINRGLNIAIFVTALGLVIIGGLAILNTIPISTAQLLKQTALLTK